MRNAIFLSLTRTLLLAATICAVGPLVYAAAPSAKDRKLVCQDQFDRAEPGDAWRIPIPTFTISNGVLVGSQTRDDHGAVARAKAEMRDGIVEFRFRLNGSSGFNCVFEDREHKGTHAGHICRVSIAPKQIRLGDDCEGVMRNDIFEMRKDPARKAEAEKLLVGRSKALPVNLTNGQWYRLRIEIIGQEMRVSLDDKVLGSLTSPGIGHPIKREFGFTVNGKTAEFDDLSVWSTEPHH